MNFSSSASTLCNHVPLDPPLPPRSFSTILNERLEMFYLRRDTTMDDGASRKRSLWGRRDSKSLPKTSSAYRHAREMRNGKRPVSSEEEDGPRGFLKKIMSRKRGRKEGAIPADEDHGDNLEAFLKHSDDQVQARKMTGAREPAKTTGGLFIASHVDRSKATRPSEEYKADVSSIEDVPIDIAPKPVQQDIAKQWPNSWQEKIPWAKSSIPSPKPDDFMGPLDTRTTNTTTSENAEKVASAETDVAAAANPEKPDSTHLIMPNLEAYLDHPGPSDWANHLNNKLTHSLTYCISVHPGDSQSQVDLWKTSRGAQLEYNNGACKHLARNCEFVSTTTMAQIRRELRKGRWSFGKWLRALSTRFRKRSGGKAFMAKEERNSTSAANDEGGAEAKGGQEMIQIKAEAKGAHEK